MRRTTFAALIVGVMHSGTLHAQATQSRTNPSLDSLIASQMDNASLMGVGAAIIVDRQLVWMKGYGFADIGRTRPFTPGTIMNVGSIAKVVTGVAMMRAVQEGKLSLDTNINRYLPWAVSNPRHPAVPITLRHLATHTSGITDRWEVYRESYHFGGDSPVPLERFLADYFAPGGRHHSPGNFLDAPPGTVREYSNIGASLAGHIVERTYGEPLNVLTRRWIFEPLGMTQTGWFLSEVDMTRHSTLFVSQGGFAIPIPHYGGTTYPDGWIRTSVEDLSRLFIALLDGGAYRGARILEPGTVAEMKRFQFSDANRPTNYPAADGNSGLFWRTKFNGTRVGYGGNDPGLQTEMLANLDGSIGVIMFVNTSVSGTDARAPSAIFTALWEWAETLRTAP